MHMQVQASAKQPSAALEPICVDEPDEPSAPADLTLRLSSEERDTTAEQPEQIGRPTSQSITGGQEAAHQPQPQQTDPISQLQPASAFPVQMNPFLLQEVSPPPEQSHSRGSSPALAFPTFELPQHPSATPCQADSLPKAAPLTAPANLYEGADFQATFPMLESLLAAAPSSKRQKRRLSPIPDATAEPRSAANIDRFVSERPHGAQPHVTMAAAAYSEPAGRETALPPGLQPPQVTQRSQGSVVNLFDASTKQPVTSLEHEASWKQQAQTMGIQADSEASAREAIADLLNTHAKAGNVLAEWHVHESANSLQAAEAESSRLHQAHTGLNAQPSAAYQSVPIDLSAEDEEAGMQYAASAQTEKERLEQEQHDAHMAAQLQDEEDQEERSTGNQLAELQVRMQSCAVH